MIYNNYHKHTKYSSAISPDTHIDMESYFKRAKELGHDKYFTTEHGFGGSIFEALDLQNKYGVKVICAMEIYVVLDNKEKNSTNSHMILIAKNNKARRQMNLFNSLANEIGYYYKPRWSLSDVLSLDKDSFFVTTACVAGIAKNDELLKSLTLPILNHFGVDNFFWEVQFHNELIQISHNKKMIEYSYTYGGKIIHGNDSHYIYKEQGKDRLSYLKGKGISYDDEDSFILDYPDIDTIVSRYKKQNVLNESQILESINNTLLIDSEEYVDIDKSIKMPNVYEGVPRDRFLKFSKLINDKWEVESKKIPVDKHRKYIESINFEMSIVENTNEVVHTADYFLLDHDIISLGIKKYGGRITKTGRGSAPSFYLNKLLGFTSIDRNALDVPMFPTRFISETRLLETRSLPDIDLNLTDPEPFIKASKEILGEHGCYWMLAYGTSQESDAFRNVCRDMDISFDEFNEVAKDLESYVDHPKWGEIIKKSKAQIGAITSVSRHPCATLLLSQDIREEIGLIRAGKELCCVMTSLESDNYKYLKNDLLTVSVYGLIYNTCDMIGIEVPEVSELISLLDDDVWKIYELGHTGTLNQTSTENGRRLVKIYKPKSYQELSAWVAAIRPGFASQLDGFLNRRKFTNGVDALDELLYQSSKMMLYQESVMLFLNWCGLPEDETYGIIKMISKKKLKDEELVKLKSKLIEGWIKNVGTDEGFEQAWLVVEQNAEYSFNASHSVSVALDSIYGAWLKAKYPYEYYTVAFNMYESDLDMTKRLADELSYFNISLKPPTFKYSKGEYSFDKNIKQITKGIGSIKSLNSKVGDELYELRNNKYDTFTDLLEDLIKNTSANSKQILILIKLDYFSEFGKSKKLIQIYNLFYDNDMYKKKTAKKENLSFDIELVRKYSEKETEKQFSKVDYISIIRELEKDIPNEDFSMKQKIEWQLEFIGSISIIDQNRDKREVIVLNLDTKYSPKATLYCINNGKTQVVKFKKKPRRKQPDVVYFEDKPVNNGDIIYIKKFSKEPAKKKVGDDWIATGEIDWWATQYEIIER